MAKELKKVDPAGLLGHHASEGEEERINSFIKSKGYVDENDLEANGTAENKEQLKKFKDLAALGKDHHDQLEAWLLLANQLVDEVVTIKARLDALEKH